ncbi:MAG: heparinase II/III family protein [Armatimonadota bacterium]|nr:heparinase II/III family protein [Armatimonadota bacterium]
MRAANAVELLASLWPWSAYAAAVSLALCAVGAGAEEHPVYTSVDADRAQEYEQAVERVMSMSEEEMLSYLPEKPYIRFCECPNCYGGSQGNNIFTWTIDRPDELTCRHCGEVIHPPDEAYPETHVLVGENALGERVEYSYYLNEETGARHFLSGHLLMYKRNWLTQQCIALGEAYQATGKPEYARRVVLVLDRAAQLYPHYPAVHNRNARGIRFCESQEPPYAWDAGRWGNFHNEIPRRLILAYDLIYDSDQFEALSAERGYDVRARLEEDFLRETFRALEVNAYHVSNVVGYDITSAAMLGRVIGDPDMVHRAFGWMKQNLDEGFFFDGTWHESPSYHYMTLGGLRRAFSVVEGYSDPPGYVDEVDGRRFDDLDPGADLPFWAKVQDAFKAVAFPDGCSTPVHDTWAHQRRAEPRTRTVSTILPGYGHASLGCGQAASQMQAQLHFSGAYGHSHRDTLNLTLWAKQREMLSDIGYTWTNMRWWAVSTISHNLVAVDRQEQEGRPSDGDLLWFLPSETISVVAADGRRAYANIEGLDMYRRLLVLVPVSEEDAYVVDISRTRGGSVHDWLLHGSADEDMTARASLQMEEAGSEFAGEEPPRTYDVWRNVQHGTANDGFNITFTYADEPQRGIRTHLLAGAPTRVYLGETPSIRRAGQGTRGDNRKVLDFWMPHVAARRTGDAPLHSVFAAVEEPFHGEPFLDAVTRLQVSPADEDCVAMQVTCGRITDTIISTLDEAPFTKRAAGEVTIRGRLGVVRQVDGKVTAMWLFQGRELTAGQDGIATDTGAYAGTIGGATRKADGADHDALITTAALPAGNELHGTWIIVTHGNGFRHGYEIDRIERRRGETAIILTDDHGLRIDGRTTEEVYFPSRTIEGQNTFEIPLCASMVRG